MGQALFEEATLRRSGASSRADRSSSTRCRAPTICPTFELDHTVTPSPHNPLGVKGIGEAGTIASTAAVANAVIDALEAVRRHASRHAADAGKGVARDARRQPQRRPSARAETAFVAVDVARGRLSRGEPPCIPAPSRITGPRASRTRVATLAANPDAKLLAGGHSLIPTMKLRLASPPPLVDLGGLAELRGIRRDGERLRDRRADDASGDRVLEGAEGRLSDPARSRRAHRRSDGAQPGHDRRQPRARRSGRRLSRRACSRSGATMRVEVADRERARLPPTSSSRACSRRRVAPNEVLTEIHVPVVSTGHGHGLREVRASGVALRGRRRGGGRHDDGGVCRGPRGAVTGATAQRHASHGARSRAHGKPLEDADGRCGVPGR